jgi:hypothetical protein
VSTETEDIEHAVEERRSWLDNQLVDAAPRLGVELVGEVVNTYDMRSAGAVARDGDVEVWLRVVVEDHDYQPACRWDGNIDANHIHGIPKPHVLRWTDWQSTDDYLAGRRLRSEVMTLAPGITIAPGGVLHEDPRLPENWWRDLGSALDTLAAFPMNRDNELGAVRYTINGLRQHFNVVLDEGAFTDLTWTTTHADLHWGNLRGPELCILDWESWRPAPAGYDAATLYCNSVLHPPTAQRIRAMPVLNTRGGQFALLSAICRYLNTAGESSDLDQLEVHLRAEADTIVANLH